MYVQVCVSKASNFMKLCYELAPQHLRSWKQLSFHNQTDTNGYHQNIYLLTSSFTSFSCWQINFCSTSCICLALTDSNSCCCLWSTSLAVVYTDRHYPLAVYGCYYNLLHVSVAMTLKTPILVLFADKQPVLWELGSIAPCNVVLIWGQLTVFSPVHSVKSQQC